MNPIKGVLLASFGTIFAIVFLILTMPYLAGLGFLPAATASAITQTGSNYSAELPYVALLVLGGIALRIGFGKN